MCRHRHEFHIYRLRLAKLNWFPTIRDFTAINLIFVMPCFSRSNTFISRSNRRILHTNVFISHSNHCVSHSKAAFHAQTSFFTLKSNRFERVSGGEMQRIFRTLNDTIPERIPPQSLGRAERNDEYYRTPFLSIAVLATSISFSGHPFAAATSVQNLR